MTRHYTPAGYRTIRAGTSLVATEYRRDDGSTIQMAGHGDEVEAILRGKVREIMGVGNG